MATGSDFIKQILTKVGVPREQDILAEFTAGNVPSFLQPTSAVSARDAKGLINITYHVMPDYLCIGADADFVRIPMFPATAQKVANLFDCSLPTKKMVDQIFAAASVKLEPKPMGTKDMTKSSRYKDHNDVIEKQLSSVSFTLGDLIGGHKKDIILSKALERWPSRVIIYGWHQKSNKGAAIQPLSWVHGNDYVDYSHGVRLVKGTIQVNGTSMLLVDALQDKNIAPVLSHEGALSAKSVRVP